jgi:hypothetical protein
VCYILLQFYENGKQGAFIMTEKEKSHAGMLYQPGDPELVSDRDITIKKLRDYTLTYTMQN